MAFLVVVSLLMVLVVWFCITVVQIPSCPTLVQIPILLSPIFFGVVCSATLLMYCLNALVILSSNVTLLLLYMLKLWVKLKVRTSKSKIRIKVKIKALSNLVGLICLMLICNASACAAN